MNIKKLQISKLLLGGLLVITSSLSNAQDLAWKGISEPKYFGGFGDAFAESSSMKIDSEGSVYICGVVHTVSHTFDIDMGPGETLLEVNNDPMYLVKYDKNRNLLWHKIFDVPSGTYTSGKLVMDNSDNIYMATMYSLYPPNNPIIDLDPSAGVLNFTPNNQTTNTSAISIVKLDKNGSFLWGKGMDGDGSERLNDFKIDKNGNLMLIINLQGSINFDPLGASPVTTSTKGDWSAVHFAKYDQNGVFLSVNSIVSTKNVMITALDFDAQNNLYLSGNYDGDCNFDIMGGTNTKSTGALTNFSAKYDNLNNLEWFFNHDYSVNEIKYSQSNNSVWYTGSFLNTVDLDNSSATSNVVSNGQKDIYVLQTNTSGTFLNGFSVGGAKDDNGYKLGVDNIGNIYLLGSCMNIPDIDLDPSFSVKNIGVWPGLLGTDLSYFISKYSSSGSFLWATTIADTLPNGKNNLSPEMSLLTVSINGGIEIDNNSNIYSVISAWDYGYGPFKNYFRAHKFTQDPNLVWPGDANDDLVANNTDLLAIGLAYGTTGTPRADNSIDWVGKIATLWGTTLPNGADYNNTDCNGDGVINADDTTAILLNYNQTHTLKLAPNIAGVNDPTLLVDFPAGNYSNGTIITIPVKLGNSTIPANNAYGLAFTLDYPTTGFDANSVKIKFNNSWMGTYNTDFIGLQKNFPNNKQIDVALTRINHTNITGNGTICEISIIVDNLGGITALKLANIVEQFSLSKASLIDKDGVLIPINLQGDSVQIISSINDVNLEKSIAVYPNPATDNVLITSANTIKSVVINDIAGKQVYAVAGAFANLTINLSTVNGGIYFATIQTEEGVIRKKITVKH